MLSSAICGIAAIGATLSKVRPWPACGSMPFFAASAAAVGEPAQLGGARLALGMGIAAGVELDDRRAEARAPPRSAPDRLDEQADADAGARQLVDEIGEVVVLAGGVEPALGGPLLALFRDDAGGMRAVAQRDLEHLLGRRHLQVQRQVELGHQPGDVGVGDVAAVLAQVRGDPVGAGLGGEQAARDRVGMLAAARVADRRDMVDVDAEAKFARHEAATSSEADEPKPDIMMRSRVETGSSKAARLSATIAPVRHR